MKKKVCCICGKEFTGWGNNPWPVKDEFGSSFKPEDECCDECNSEKVIPARLQQFFDNIDTNKKTN